MMVLIRALVFLVRLVFDLYITILMLRLLLQKLKASYYNPVSQFLVKVTDIVVLPFRRVMPGFQGFDLGIVALIFIFEGVKSFLILALHFSAFPNWTGILIVSLGEIASMLINLYFYAILLCAVMSWFASLRQGPIAEIVFLMADPVLYRIRHYIPLFRGMDFSSLIALILIELLSLLFFMPLVAWGTRLSG